MYAQNDNEQKNISETKEEYQIQVLNELKELGINARISNGEIELVNKSYENIQKVNVLIDENDEKVNYTYSNELSYASGGKYPTSWVKVPAYTVYRSSKAKKAGKMHSWDF